MASLLFAASYLTYNKIKTKREEKKEKKRQAYAQRYTALEREHMRNAEMQSPQQQQTGDSNGLPASPSSTQHAELQSGVRSSSESLRSEKSKTDGPSVLVDEALKERSKGGLYSSPKRGGEGGEKMRRVS